MFDIQMSFFFAGGPQRENYVKYFCLQLGRPCPRVRGPLDFAPIATPPATEHDDDHQAPIDSAPALFAAASGAFAVLSIVGREN